MTATAPSATWLDDSGETRLLWRRAQSSVAIRPFDRGARMSVDDDDYDDDDDGEGKSRRLPQWRALLISMACCLVVVVLHVVGGLVIGPWYRGPLISSAFPVPREEDVSDLFGGALGVAFPCVCGCLIPEPSPSPHPGARARPSPEVLLFDQLPPFTADRVKRIARPPQESILVAIVGTERRAATRRLLVCVQQLPIWISMCMCMISRDDGVQCVGRILGQMPDPIDVVVLDDAGPVDLLQELQGAGIIVLPNDVPSIIQGRASQWNKAWRLFRSEPRYTSLFLVESDVVLAPDTFTRLDATLRLLEVRADAAALQTDNHDDDIKG